MIQEIDGIKYSLKEKIDFSWLHKYGKVFTCIDQTGSGCINFGVEDGDKKYFIKIAGANTINAEISKEESIELLKEAIIKYQNIKSKYLIKLIESFDYNNMFVVVYEYSQGECLFDHWNFDMYENDKSIITPKQKFKSLSVEKRLIVVTKLFSFFKSTIKAGYIAVDFYDSSIIYDFERDEVSFCDIDLFRKNPTTNDIGEGYFGTKRLKAPEENILGSVIDEITNEFTLGAIIFDIFSNVKNNDERYKVGHFIPNDFDEFELSKKRYDVLIKATSIERHKRYKTIEEFEKYFFES